MIRTYIIFFILLIISSCHRPRPKMYNGSPIWLGYMPKDSVAVNFSWYPREYRSYQPDSITILKLKDLAPQYEIITFAGVWCPNTQQLLPQFYKTMDLIEMPGDRLKLYLLDHDKESPKGVENQYKVINVPTFIVFKNGQEKGRIVEYVKKSIEEDLLNIMEGNGKKKRKRKK